MGVKMEDKLDHPTICTYQQKVVLIQIPTKVHSKHGWTLFNFQSGKFYFCCSLK